jgi:hypothetical protein
MDEAAVLTYLHAAAQVVGLPLDDARAQAVAPHFMRTVAIARTLDGAPLAPEDELAQIYCPAPFPMQDAA